MNTHNPSVGVAFITHSAKRHLSRCLPPILQSKANPQVLVVNSSSNDGTVEEAKRLGAKTLVIPRASFNHGLTRELARKTLATDIVVMMTPDAYATSDSMLEKLVEPIIKGHASASYARQVAHDGASFLEAFPRHFNYPEHCHIRGIQDIQRYGSYTFFCSDSCAAYSNAALDEVGGFPEVLIGEDTCAVASLLHKGHKVAYVAKAVVKHSHAYTLAQEFRRHFDTGLARKQFQSLIQHGGKDESRGIQYAKSLLSTLVRQRPYLLPYAIMQTTTKWIGYRLGQASIHAPTAWKQWCSSQDFYWQSDAFKAKSRKTS